MPALPSSMETSHRQDAARRVDTGLCLYSFTTYTLMFHGDAGRVNHQMQDAKMQENTNIGTHATLVSQSACTVYSFNASQADQR